MERTTSTAAPRVGEFRQIIVWPLQLMPGTSSGAAWEALFTEEAGGRWHELDDDFPEDSALYQERHYREFVAFLPHVQRFLYGERASRSGRTTYGDSPIRIFRRSDVAAVRITRRGRPDPLVLDVVHVDLYFFYDVDVVILVVEVEGRDLPLPEVQDVVYRLGRAYPAGWEADGTPSNCFEKVEWLDAAGAALAASDYERREKFMASVCRHQVTAISRHWEFLLEPMAPDQSDRRASARYRQLEFHRMPIMVWLALDDPRRLTRADHMRLAFAGAPDRAEGLPYGEGFLCDFEKDFCYDRFHDPERPGWCDTRLMCSGQAFVAIGEAGKPLFCDAERGFLAQFRHQFFLTGLVAHFHRAALLMLSDRLVATVSRLDPSRKESVARFRHDIRATLEIFLRFTHRYYFSEISDQATIRDVFRLWCGHLGTERLYQELREEINDMSSYLETDLLRRQAVTILQLTVVTLFSQIGMLATGFLGMNIFGWAEAETWDKVSIFLVVLIPSALITFYTVYKARRLAAFLDALADERLGWGAKFKTLSQVWKKGP